MGSDAPPSLGATCACSHHIDVLEWHSDAMGVCVFSKKKKKALIARERRCTTHDIGKSARTFAKCVIR